MFAQKLDTLRSFASSAFVERSNGRFLGFCLCRIWVYTFFLALGGRITAAIGDYVLINLGNAVFFGSGALAALAIALLAPRIVGRFPKGFVVATPAVGLVSAILLIALEGAENPALVVLAAAGGGFVLALMRVAWGCVYGCLETRFAGLYTALSFFIAVIAVVLLRLLPNVVTYAVLLILPVVAAGLLKRLFALPICVNAVTAEAHDERSMRAFWPLAVSMFVFVAASAALRALFEGNASSEWITQWQTTLVDGVVAVLFFATYLLLRDMDSLPVYRCAIPLIVMGYTVFPLLWGEHRVIGVMFAAVGYGLFDLLSWVVMLQFVHDGHGGSLRVLGIGVGATLAGRTFGSIAGGACLGLQAQGLLDFSAVSLVMTFLLLLVCVLILPERVLMRVAKNAVDSSQDEGMAAGQDALRGSCLRLAKDKGLTPRETDVLLLLARGRNAQAIARELKIASGTVQTHIKHVYSKTGMHTQQELIDLLEQMSSVGGPSV